MTNGFDYITAYLNFEGYSKLMKKINEWSQSVPCDHLYTFLQVKVKFLWIKFLQKVIVLRTKNSASFSLSIFIHYSIHKSNCCVTVGS